MFIKKRFICILTGVCLLCPQLLWAACLPAELCAQVSDLEDFSFGTYGYGGDIQIDIDICPHTQNDDEDDYDLVFTGSGGAGAYEITTGAVDITYSVLYEDDTTIFVPTTANGNATFSGANQASADCSVGGETGTVRVFIPSGNLEYSTSGTYTGTLSIDMTPD